MNTVTINDFVLTFEFYSTHRIINIEVSVKQKRIQVKFRIMGIYSRKLVDKRLPT